MRLLMMGTGPFAVPTLEGLYQTHHEVVAVVTSPVRTQPGRPVPENPMRKAALTHETEIFDPPDINVPEVVERLEAYRADLFVVCDYGQILSAQTLATARLGGINLHASLLPRYRGAAPINWALYHGEKETGVTVIHMTPQVDAGPCVAQARTEILAEETAVELERRLSEIGAWLVRRTIDSFESGRLEALPQNPALASRAPRLKKTDGAIDWHRPARAICNQIRAMEPWPKSYTYWHRRRGPPVRLILKAIGVEASPPADAGTVLEAAGSRLLVAAGDGAVAIRCLQPAGKRDMPVDEFLRGYHVEPGDRLGPES